MPYSIELFFDSATTASVRSTWALLADVSGSQYMVDHGVYPHVALAVFDADSIPPSLPGLLGGLATRMGPQTLSRGEIQCFRGQAPVVFLGFEICSFLQCVHERVQTIIDQLQLSNHAYYRAGQWIPHCTLAMEFPAVRLTQTLDAARQHPLPVQFRATALGLIQYPPTQLLWHGRLGPVEAE